MRVLLLMVFLFSLSCWAGESNPPVPSAAQGSNNKGQIKQKPNNSTEAQEREVPAAPGGMTVLAKGGTNNQPQRGEDKTPE